MMFILGIICAAFVAAMVIVLTIRILFDARLVAIQKEPNHSRLFRRKVEYLKKIEQTRTVRYLLVSGLIFGLSLIFCTSSYLLLDQKSSHQTQELSRQIKRLEQQQKQVIASIPLQSYPEEGIGLKQLQWKKLADEEQDSDLQEQIELTIAQKTLRYFGSFDTKISLVGTQKMSLHLKGNFDDVESKEMIKKNIDHFAKEAEELPNLTEIHVQMISSVGEKSTEVYSTNYSREKDTDSFNKKNVSEQNLKNDGGKG